MACSICNDARARKNSDLDDVPASDLKRSAQTCRVCSILLSTMEEQGFSRRDEVHIANDTNIYHSRPTHGILVLVPKDGEA